MNAISTQFDLDSIDIIFPIDCCFRLFQLHNHFVCVHYFYETRRLPLLLVLLLINQLVRSPFHIWNWMSELSLWSSNYQSVLYESSSAKVEVLERVASSDTGRCIGRCSRYALSDRGVETFLESVQFDGTTRFIRWFGRGESEWLGNTIVFSDLDTMLNIALSDVDEATPIAFVGQGSGAQLAIRYALQNPSRPIQLIATHSEGFAVPRTVPQMISELKESSAADVGDRWLPAFVYHDWLTWLHNPFSDAIEKETHLVPKFKHVDLTPHLQEQTVWVGFAPSVSDGEPVLESNCPRVRLKPSGHVQQSSPPWFSRSLE